MEATALETVLTTLFDNAHQAGASAADVSVRRMGDDVVLQISDNGPGIPPGDRQRIFNPFFTSKRTSGGTGLGLPIVNSIISSHGGTLALGNAPDGGAQVTVILPEAGKTL